MSSLYDLYYFCKMSIPDCISADSCAELMEVNHDDEVVDTERFNISQEIEDVTLESMQPAEQEVAKRLTTPIVNTYLDTKDIAFERQGIFFCCPFSYNMHRSNFLLSAKN